MTTKTFALTVITAALVVTLAGCSALEKVQSGGAQPSGQASTPAQPQPAETQPAQQAPEVTQPPGAAAAAQSGQPIVSSDVASQGTTLRVEITGLQRQGQFVTLSWTITNTGETDWSMSSNLGDTPAGLGLTVAGVSLVDTTNARRYRVARTGDEDSPTCVCSEYDVTTDPDEAVPLYATFRAPPPEVTQINVEFPILGVFNGVPIS